MRLALSSSRSVVYLLSGRIGVPRRQHDDVTRVGGAAQLVEQSTPQEGVRDHRSEVDAAHTVHVQPKQFRR